MGVNLLVYMMLLDIHNMLKTFGKAVEMCLQTC